MYDTVNFSLSSLDAQGVELLEEVPCYLDENTISLHNFGGVAVVAGRLGCLSVSVTRYQARIGGSICKWYLGNNYETMRLKDVRAAVERLSDTLHLPIAAASVSRMDLAKNIITRHPVTVYLAHLGELRRATRLAEPNGLYYARRDGRLCFYDKNREQRDKGEPVPELYAGRNVLRYEQRYNRRVAAAFGMDSITGATLYDEHFYVIAVRRWIAAYRAIEKINDITLNFQHMTSKKQLYALGVLSLVERAGGELAMLSQISEAMKRGDLTRKQAHDLRQAVKEACAAGDGLTARSEAIEELDGKMTAATMFYR